MRLHLALIFLLGLSVTSSQAGEADVVGVKVKKIGTDIYSFHVTVQHKDEGWGHYANKWDVLGADGTVYGTRTLHHPHVDEQPFTRSLTGVKISGVKQVTIRVHDSVHEYGGAEVKVALPLE
jgi:hypothetical protein